MKYIVTIIMLAFAANSNFAAEKVDTGISIEKHNLWKRDEGHYIVEHLTPQDANTFSLVSKDAYHCIQLRGHIKIKSKANPFDIKSSVVISIINNSCLYIKSLDLSNFRIEPKALHHINEKCIILKKLSLCCDVIPKDDLKALMDRGVEVKVSFTNFRTYDFRNHEYVTFEYGQLLFIRCTMDDIFERRGR